VTSDLERELLLRIARAAITGHVCAAPPATVDAGEMTLRLGGAFVTLHKGNELRGCIGHIEADEPLPQVVARCAIEACSSDPRFPPVTEVELTEIEIELSLLGPLEPIEGPADIEVGRHGLVVERGWRRGLLLPQVATERKWDSEKFIAQTCHKAGLPPDAWRHGATVWRFEAEVFAE
jgi:uncharacterized protein